MNRDSSKQYLHVLSREYCEIKPAVYYILGNKIVSYTKVVDHRNIPGMSDSLELNGLLTGAPDCRPYYLPNSYKWI